MSARPCGAYADHVDHIDPRLGRDDSALRPTGSTRRWRRIRAYVLDRDGHRCQVLLDPTGESGTPCRHGCCHVVESPRPATPPTGPDDLAWLRATCPHHNLTRGAAITDARSSTTPTPTRWSW